ncbi:MAG: hypothetical protein KAR31_13160, partial [Candidatus Omnitrophica bacterium]|nr:hypothetical protein [Candidatus Omnitrophota bacterium]
VEVAERHKTLAGQHAALLNQEIAILSQINALIGNNAYFTPEAGRIIKAAIDMETENAMTNLQTVNDRREIEKNPQGAVLRAQDRALTEGRQRIKRYNDEFVVARDDAIEARTEFETQLRTAIDDAVTHNRALFARVEELKAKIREKDSLSVARERELLMDVMEYVYKNQVAVPYYAESAGVYYVNGESTGDRQPHGRQPFEDSTNDYTKVGNEWSSDHIFAKEWKWNDDVTYFGMNTRNKADGGAYIMRRGLLFDSSEGNEINQWGFFGNRSSRFIQDDPMDEESGYTEDEYSGGFTHNFFRDNGTLFYGGSSMAQVDRNGDLGQAAFSGQVGTRWTDKDTFTLRGGFMESNRDDSRHVETWDTLTGEMAFDETVGISNREQYRRWGVTNEHQFNENLLGFVSYDEVTEGEFAGIYDENVTRYGTVGIKGKAKLFGDSLAYSVSQSAGDLQATRFGFKYNDWLLANIYRSEENFAANGGVEFDVWRDIRAGVNGGVDHNGNPRFGFKVGDKNGVNVGLGWSPQGGWGLPRVHIGSEKEERPELDDMMYMTRPISTGPKGDKSILVHVGTDNPTRLTPVLSGVNPQVEILNKKTGEWESLEISEVTEIRETRDVATGLRIKYTLEDLKEAKEVAQHDAKARTEDGWVGITTALYSIAST